MTIKEMVQALYDKEFVTTSRQIINLGTGTSFNVSSYDGYKNFTNDNFIIGASSGNCPSLGSKTENSTRAKANGFTISKSYNASTGILTISGNTQTCGAVDGTYTSQWNTSVTQTMTCFCYLII